MAEHANATSSLNLEDLPPSSVFAKRYRVTRRVGSGGFGSVYEAQHVVTGRRCALKVLWSHLARDSEFRRRFLQESRVAAKLENEHIVQVLDAGIDEDSDTPFIVMELLQGEDLAKRLARKERFTNDETIVYLSHVAVALDLTHAASIIHRDLKPGNLFLTQRSDGSPLVKILDFGIAKFLAEQSMNNATHSAGTPLYMAPEQFRQSSISSAVDVYALGMIAFRFLVGQHYFAIERQSCDNAYALGMVLAEGAPERASVRARRYGIALPPAIDAWFARIANVDPKLRYANARDAVLELAAALGVEPRAPLVRSGKLRLTGALSHAAEPAAFETVPAQKISLSVESPVPASATPAGAPPTQVYSQRSGGSTVRLDEAPPLARSVTEIATLGSMGPAPTVGLTAPLASTTPLIAPSSTLPMPSTSPVAQGAQPEARPSTPSLPSVPVPSVVTPAPRTSRLALVLGAAGMLAVALIAIVVLVALSSRRPELLARMPAPPERALASLAPASAPEPAAQPGTPSAPSTQAADPSPGAQKAAHAAKVEPAPPKTQPAPKAEAPSPGAKPVPAAPATTDTPSTLYTRE